MRVLVIGGTRFVGRAIVSRIIREGHEVTLLNRGLTPDPFGTSVRRILGDRRNHETFRRAAAQRDHDAVIDITAYQEAETASAIAAFAGRTGHFIHISTAAVYLIRDKLQAPFREDDLAGRLTPRASGTQAAWHYAYRKRRCEESLRHAWETRRFPFTALRLPIVVGPHDYTRRTDAYLERLIQPGPLLLPEGGLNSWGFLWVDDIAEVVASNLGNQTAHGRAYNLAQREALSLRQLVELAAECLGCEAQVLSMPTAWLDSIGLGTTFSPYSHDRDLLLDCRRAAEELLFEPTSPEQWVPALVDDFQARWDGVPRAFANTRAFELSLAKALGNIHLPTYIAEAKPVKASSTWDGKRGRR